MGENTSRVILLTDTFQPHSGDHPAIGQKALLVGDNTAAPPMDFLENPDQVRPGDRVMTSGDGGVFPPGC